MQERHVDRSRYFNEQSITSERYVLPYIADILPIDSNLVMAEIGCGEGGNMKPFLDKGCTIYGIDLAANKIENAKKFFADHPNRDKLHLIAEDIYKIEPDSIPKFDLIMMRDTLEHIHDQEKFLKYLKQFLTPNGKVFLGFPPWVMPFGGHQQMCKSKLLSVAPYYHILPMPVYKGILKLFGETEKRIEDLVEIKETRISLVRFKRMMKKLGYKIDKETKYFINPNYEAKFKLKPRKLLPVFNVPYISEFYVTTYYCIISNNTKN
jgi:2-polyprenyl-3-methyl-5-hydroxy-6-metoxy-1,4-benzoquinol methylase